MSRKPMMSVVNATEARQNFGKIISRAYSGQEHLVIEKNGLPVVVVLSVQDYERLRQEAAMQNLVEMGEALSEKAKRKGLSPESLLEQEERVKEDIFEDLYGRQGTQ